VCDSLTASDAFAGPSTLTRSATFTTNTSSRSDSFAGSASFTATDSFTASDAFTMSETFTQPPPATPSVVLGLTSSLDPDDRGKANDEEGGSIPYGYVATIVLLMVVLAGLDANVSFRGTQGW